MIKATKFHIWSSEGKWKRRDWTQDADSGPELVQSVTLAYDKGGGKQGSEHQKANKSKMEQAINKIQNVQKQMAENPRLQGKHRDHIYTREDNKTQVKLIIAGQVIKQTGKR